MIKQEFENPELEVIKIEVTDVITTSGGEDGLTSGQAPILPEILEGLE